LGYAHPDAEALARAHQLQVAKFVQLPRCRVGLLKRHAIIGGGHLRELTKQYIGKFEHVAQYFNLGHWPSRVG
jgi:hypothetical protein